MLEVVSLIFQLVTVKYVPLLLHHYLLDEGFHVQYVNTQLIG
ncbi:hypothetical protein AAAC51_17400 [Priestia megaterium]